MPRRRALRGESVVAPEPARPALSQRRPLHNPPGFPRRRESRRRGAPLLSYAAPRHSRESGNLLAAGSYAKVSIGRGDRRSAPQEPRPPCSKAKPSRSGRADDGRSALQDWRAWQPVPSTIAMPRNAARVGTLRPPRRVVNTLETDFSQFLNAILNALSIPYLRMSARRKAPAFRLIGRRCRLRLRCSAVASAAVWTTKLYC